ncbi:MAG: VOC family protein, partial [Proteobacteria bacterium]|nr:VOC family protein [Pseudomonadota bacterium]
TITVLLLAFSLSACSTVGGPSSSGFSLSDEPLLGKFVWHDLVTEDTAAARRFYAGLFGWTFEETERPGGGAYILAKSNGRYIGGMVQRGDLADGKNVSRWLGYLSVADVTRAVEATRAAGGTVIVDVRELGNIGKVAAIQDPQGAVIGLVRSKHGDPDDSAQNALGSVVWNELLASDSQAAATFYTTLAGYQTQSINRRGGQYTKLNQGSRERAGILTTPFADYPPTWLTYFAVADPVAATAKVVSLGGKIILAPSADMRENSMAVISDPSGAVLVLQKWPL